MAAADIRATTHLFQLGRIKKNIEDNNVGLDAITQVRVNEYRTLDEIKDWSGDERERHTLTSRAFKSALSPKKYKKFCRT